MTEQEIIEGNKLIAEFMGYKYFPHPDELGMPGWRLQSNKNFIPKLIYHGEIGKRPMLCRVHRDLRFHTSLDWLHPVLEKITKLNPKEGKLHFWYNLSYCHCNIWANGTFGIEWECKENSGTSIDAAFNVVIQFIHWYQTQTPTK